MPPGEPGFSQLAPVLVRKYTFQIKMIKKCHPGSLDFPGAGNEIYIFKSKIPSEEPFFHRGILQLALDSEEVLVRKYTFQIFSFQLRLTWLGEIQKNQD